MKSFNYQSVKVKANPEVIMAYSAGTLAQQKYSIFEDMKICITADA